MSSGWKVRVKHRVAGVLYYGGWVKLRRAWLRTRAVILAYHRVLPADDQALSFTQPGMYVTEETFDNHIRYLASHYEIVGLADLLSRPFDRTCAITFDDGWRDTYSHAFPILRKYGAPATVFAATNLIGTGAWPWPDRICYYIHNSSAERFAAALADASRERVADGRVPSDLPSDRCAAAEQVLKSLKGLAQKPLDEILSCLDRSFAALNATLHETRPWMTWEEVQKLSSGGIAFGSHTENHPILTNVPKARAQAEIVNSRRVLSERIGRPVSAFCYPNGAYDSDVVQIVKQAGYSLAVTTTRGFIDVSTPPLTLNRLMVHNDMTDTTPMFACMLSNAVPLF